MMLDGTMKRQDLKRDSAVSIPLIIIYAILLACVAFSPFNGQVVVPLFVVASNIATFCIYYCDRGLGMGPWRAQEVIFYIFLGTGGFVGYFMARCACGHEIGDKLHEFVHSAFLMALSGAFLFIGVVVVVAVLHSTKNAHYAMVALAVYFVMVNLATFILILYDACRNEEGSMPLFAIMNFVAIGGIVAGPVGLCLMGCRDYRSKPEFICFSVFWVICVIIWAVLGFYGINHYLPKTTTTVAPETTSAPTSETTSPTTKATTSATTSLTTTAANTTISNTTTPAPATTKKGNSTAAPIAPATTALPTTAGSVTEPVVTTAATNVTDTTSTTTTAKAPTSGA